MLDDEEYKAQFKRNVVHLIRSGNLTKDQLNQIAEAVYAVCTGTNMTDTDCHLISQAVDPDTQVKCLSVKDMDEVLPAQYTSRLYNRDHWTSAT